MSYKIKASALSDAGQIRLTNEDAWGWIPELNFYVLADGMGGHIAGEVASNEAVAAAKRIIRHLSVQLPQDQAKQAFVEMINQINATIYQLSSTQQHFRKMGTTICCLQFRAEGVIYCYVGDSRIYRLHDNHLIKLSHEHSLLSELIAAGKLSPEQANDPLYKNVLTRAIGAEPMVEPEVGNCELWAGDKYLICSDGLSDEVNDSEIEEILLSNSSLEQAVKNLISKAKQRGGHDNITVILTEVLGD